MLDRAKRAFLTQQLIEDQHTPEYPLYPFNVDFLAQKKKQSEWKPITLPSQEATEPIPTDIEPSEHYSEQQFDSYSSCHSLEESISEESIVNEVKTSTEKQSHLYSTEKASLEEQSQYEFLSQSRLRKMNEKLVALKEEFRQIARKYTHNSSILTRQRAELEKLRSQKKKALDYNYELELSKQEARERVHSHAVSESIGKTSTKIKKLRYKRVREGGSKDPFDADCQLLDSRITDQQPHMSRLFTTRQEVLCKLRQEQNNSQLLQALVLKEEDYLRLIDVENGRLCRGDTDSLRVRVEFLKNQLKIKQDMMRVRQEECHLEITDLQTEINAVDFKIARTEWSIRKAQLQRQERQGEEGKREDGPVSKLKNMKRKKNSSLMIKILKPISPRSIVQLSEECTPITHSKVKISFDQSMASPPQLKNQKYKKSRPHTKYFRQNTTHK